MAFGPEIEKGSGNKDLFLKVEEGKNVRLHIVSKEPYCFKSYFNQKANKGIRIPLDKEIPGLKLTTKYAIVVLVEEAVNGVSEVKAKVFEFGKMIKKQLDETYEVYNQDFSKCDFVVGKTGKKLTTKWTAIPCPAKGMKFNGDLPNLTDAIKMSSESDVLELGQPNPEDIISSETVSMLKLEAKKNKKTWEDVCNHVGGEDKVAKLTVEQSKILLDYIQS